MQKKDDIVSIDKGDVLIIKAFDDVPEHLFRVEEVFEDHITGVALSGPLAGAYGEPELERVSIDEFEGYYSLLCPQGHNWKVDVYNSQPEANCCPRCSALPEFEALVNTTDGVDKPPAITLMEETTVTYTVKVVTERRYAPAESRWVRVN